MDQNILIVIVVIVILIIGTKVLLSVAKQKKQEKTIVDNGTSFEAHIVGVAHPRAILNIEGQPNQVTNVLGFEATDTSQANRHENMNRIRVKIRYIDPFTRQSVITHHVFDKFEYQDDRLIKVGNPGQLTLGSKSIAYLKHNKKLYETYVNDVKGRNVSKEEEKRLLKNAALAMNNQNNQDIKDSEGYNILTPPVIAKGYKLNGEVHFIQKTNTPLFNDWTKGLE